MAELGFLLLAALIAGICETPRIYREWRVRNNNKKAGLTWVR